MASLPNLPLGLQIVEMIENIRPKKPLITKVLELQPEASPSNSWVNIASEPDLVRLPEALQSQPKFTGNLEMKRSRVSNLTGSQQLNQNQTVQQGNYTLVAQQVTHPSSYSIQQVTHHTSNQQVGSNVGYQTVSQQPIYTSTVSSSVASLNWENQNSFRMLKQSEKFLLVVPEELLAKYARLASPIVEVKSYSGEPMLADRLHNNKEFIIIVTNETNYPRLIRYPMISPRCALLVDGSKSLPESSQPDSRFSKSTIYHGTNGVEYLQRVLKSSNTPP